MPRTSGVGLCQRAAGGLQAARRYGTPSLARCQDASLQNGLLVLVLVTAHDRSFAQIPPRCSRAAAAAAAAAGATAEAAEAASVAAARRHSLYVGAPGVLGAERAGAVARVCRAQQQQQQQQRREE